MLFIVPRAGLMLLCVSGIALALFGSACVFGGGGDSASPTPDLTPAASATSEPTTSPTAVVTATPTAELPPGLEVSAAGTWESRELRAGDEVPNVLGAFVFDVEAGVGTLWSLAPGAVADPAFVFVEPSTGGEYVVAAAQIVQTSSGRSWTFERAGLVPIDDSGLALFQATGCEFWVVDLGGDEPVGRANFLLPGDRFCGVAGRFAPDGSELLVAVQSNNFDGGAELFAINLAGGGPASIGELDVTHVRFAERVAVDAALLTGALPGVAWVGRYVWGSGAVSEVSIPTGAAPFGPDRGPLEPSFVSVSPDGRWVAWADVPDLGTGLGLGGLAEWPIVVIASVEERVPVLRAHRTAMTNGIGSFDWLADSSALVVQGEAGFALLGPDGSLEALPFSVAAHFDPVPMPAPDRGDRFAYDGRVVDRAGDEVGEPPAVTDPWIEGDADLPGWWGPRRYQWGETSSRLVLVQTAIPGGDFGPGGVAALGLPPLIVTGDAAAAPQPVRLRVASETVNGSTCERHQGSRASCWGSSTRGRSW